MATVHKTRCKAVEKSIRKTEPTVAVSAAADVPAASTRVVAHSPTQFCFLYAMRYAVSRSVPKHSPRARAPMCHRDRVRSQHTPALETLVSPGPDPPRPPPRRPDPLAADLGAAASAALVPPPALASSCRSRWRWPPQRAAFRTRPTAVRLTPARRPTPARRARTGMHRAAGPPVRRSTTYSTVRTRS